MRRIFLSMIVFAGMLAAQVGPGAGPRAMMGPGPGHGSHRGPRVEALRQALGLTDAQLGQLQQLHQQLRDQLKAKWDEGRQIRQQLDDALANPATPDAELGRLMRQRQQFRNELRQLREDNRQQMTQLINGWGLGDKLAELQKAAELMPAAREGLAAGLLEPPAKRTGSGTGPVGTMRFHRRGHRHARR